MIMLYCIILLLLFLLLLLLLLHIQVYYNKYSYITFFRCPLPLPVASLGLLRGAGLRADPRGRLLAAHRARAAPRAEDAAGGGRRQLLRRGARGVPAGAHRRLEGTWAPVHR